MNNKFCCEEKVGKLFSMPLFYLDPEVAFHTNDVTLNSSIVIQNIQNDLSVFVMAIA
jgi:hypothetical protein